MSPRNRTWLLLWVIIALVGVSLSASACAGIEVVDSTPAVSTPDTFTSPLSEGTPVHNLAVLAVDFDPPLDYEQLIIRRQSVTLLVAVENTGSSTERDVTVRAQLSTPEDADLVLSQGASLLAIAPGEIQVVRFGRMGYIPYHQTYHLEVVVDAVAGESDLSDNVKAYDIQIRPQDTGQ